MGGKVRTLTEIGTETAGHDDGMTGNRATQGRRRWENDGGDGGGIAGFA